MAPIFHTQDDLVLPITFTISTWLFSRHFFPPKLMTWQWWPKERSQFPTEGPGIFIRLQGHCQDKMKRTHWEHCGNGIISTTSAFCCATVSTVPNGTALSFLRSQPQAHIQGMKPYWKCTRYKMYAKNPYLQEWRQVQRIQWLTQGDTRSIIGGPLSKPLSVRWLSMNTLPPI